MDRPPKTQKLFSIIILLYLVLLVQFHNISQISSDKNKHRYRDEKNTMSRLSRTRVYYIIRLRHS